MQTITAAPTPYKQIPATSAWYSESKTTKRFEADAEAIVNNHINKTKCKFHQKRTYMMNIPNIQLISILWMNFL